MSNSSIIGEAKNKIIKEFIKDEAIVKAIDPADVNSNEELINKYIFNFNQNPETVRDTDTFLTVQVHIIQPTYGSKTLVDAVVEIFIVSNESHMRVTNIPKVTENRNDYLSKLIDNKLNGSSLFGVGKLMLETNVEGSYQKNWLYRKMTFKVTEINDSLCSMR